MEVFEKKLEDLFTKKSFDQLTEKEKTYVLQHVTKKEYSAHHSLINNAANQLIDLDLEPRSYILNNLKQKFREKHQKESLVVNIKKPFNSKLYLNIASVLVVFFSLCIYIYLADSKKESLTLKTKEKVIEQSPEENKDKIENNKSVQITLKKDDLKSVKTKKVSSFRSEDTSYLIDNIALDDHLLGIDLETEPIGLNLKPEDLTVPLALDIQLQSKEDIYNELLKVKL